MFEIIKDFFRQRKLRKHISDIPTGFIPLEQIKTANFIIDVEEPGFDKVKEDILAWGRNTGIKTNIYFFDFRKLSKNELLLTSIQTTLLKRELSWIGMPDSEKVAPLIEEKSDLFVSLVCNSSFPNDFLSKCSKARFKIGRLAYKGHVYDMTFSGGETEELRSGIQDIFKTITEFLRMIR